jgi:uncharacterized protein YggU (UPF0235/DUF167 family)
VPLKRNKRLPEYIKVTAKAGSKKDEVAMKGDRYIVSVREPAENGRANAAIHSVLARHLSVPEKSLALVRGGDKPSKLFIKHHA